MNIYTQRISPAGYQKATVCKNVNVFVCKHILGVIIVLFSYNT